MGLPIVSLYPASRITEDLGAGPLDRLELIMTIEEHFDIIFPQDVRNNMVTLQDVTDQICNLN
jgi:acyl carrier protein